jgi:hypothetical protein
VAVWPIGSNPETQTCLASSSGLGVHTIARLRFFHMYTRVP